MFGPGATATGGEDDPIKQFPLYEKNFGSMDVWELNPE
jgi:hypothetical protein